MNPFGMSYEEQKARGEKIYNTRIRLLISPDDEHKYVMIDVLTGDYEIGDNSTKAGLILRQRRPDAVIHTMRRHHTYVGRLRSSRRVRILGDAQ